MKRMAMKKIAGLALLLCFWSQGSAQTACYPDLPPEIDLRAGMIAAGIVDSNTGAMTRDATSGKYPFLKGGFLSGGITELYSYVLADAITPAGNPSSLRSLEAYSYMGETARTDKQVGASARAGGTTSAAEKPGFVNLLGFAIEHGTIQQEFNDTTLTLSTSPYALVAAAYGDTAQTYKDYEFLNRIGVSASFDVTDKENALTNASRKQLTEWTIKVRIAGDRSLRSQEFIKFWNENIKPKIQTRLNVVTRLGRTALDADPAHAKLRRMLADPADPNDVEAKAASLNDKIADYLNANLTETRDNKIKAVKNLIICQMRNLVFEPVSQGTLPVDPILRARIVSDILPSLVSAHAQLKEARQDLETFLESFNAKPLMSFVYANERAATGHNYQVFKFLYEQKSMSPMKLIANAGVSIYNNPDPMIKQQRVRDFAAALSFEGSVRSPFTTQEEDLSKITYAFTGRYQRLLENRHVSGKKADIGTAQFRLDIPIVSGFSLPFSVSYNTATEQNSKDHFRTNFGLTLDADKLMALRKLNSMK